ncbi:MAG TPA: hypothetical protein VGH15_06975 [Caulobacteraceae bacterium]|jgi:hypothetical protein
MVEVIIAVREPGRMKPDWLAPFDLPEIPAVGSYITINHPGERAPWGEEMVVKRIWWQLFSPLTGEQNGEPTTTAEARGSVRQIIVLCEAAVGPYSTKGWRRAHEGKTGIHAFEVSRFAWESGKESPIQSRIAKRLMQWRNPSPRKPKPKDETES